MLFGKPILELQEIGDGLYGVDCLAHCPEFDVVNSDEKASTDISSQAQFSVFDSLMARFVLLVFIFGNLKVENFKRFVVRSIIKFSWPKEHIWIRILIIKTNFG